MFSWFKKEEGPEYITGRVATRKEVRFGFFSVVTDSGEEISVPYNITIPQMVIHINKATKERSKGKLIQAELVTKTQMKGKILCTVKLTNGAPLHCFLEELELKQLPSM